MVYKVDKKALILDLYAAFECAKRHKNSRLYVKHFEGNLKSNIESLADELLNKTYTPQPSSCFIIEEPKKREIFAAQFRDRIVHHLYFNYTHNMFERTFIHDCYSCIEERGTHFGIERLKKHILSESKNYTRPCFVMKLDIRGYFMHINRKKLLEIATNSIKRMAKRKVFKQGSLVWENIIDVPFVLWLTKKIILLDPQRNCRLVCGKECWEGLDKAKSLRYAPDGCGLPIGNLTSQLFSNVYMNVFDQFMKRTLKCKHYGRYVDDAFVVSKNKEWLKEIVSSIRAFLTNELSLELHMGKLFVFEVQKGVEFLGAFIKPFRTYISNKSIQRITKNVNKLNFKNKKKVWQSVCSWLGILSHYNSYNIRCRLFLTGNILAVSTLDKDVLKMHPINN